MYYSGFADEVSMDIDEQIRATKALGWSTIEMRGVINGNLTDISDKDFDIVCEKTASAGITVNCFGSGIANGRNIPEGVDEYEKAIADMKRAIPRMKRLGSKMVRGMSFKVPSAEGDFFGSVYEQKVFDTLKRITALCEDNGVTYAHENCDGYGGLSYEHSLKLVDAVRSPAFKLIIDTGNPVWHEHHVGDKPYRGQSAWEFYDKVKEYVCYVHIKDAGMTTDPVTGEKKKMHVYPGEGEGDVKRIVADILSRGYDGGFSMEMHMKPEQYREKPAFPSESAKFNLYVEYGRRFMKLVDSVKK
ncbi:MAG: sugar phosphate isomerase/epimerase [Spirochaetes bacterium]|nr:sugar phosphate isomerase/epimerase [Spirochaetota bacterium]